MSDRFYVNCLLQPGLVAVAGPEAHHLRTVCRLRPGDQVCLFNGDGHEYPAEVVDSERHRVTLEVRGVATPAREVGFRLEVAAPLPRGDRGQFLVEKLTELGVTVFVPLRTQRSVVHPADNRLEKLQRYVIEASKQCGRNVLMQVESLADWTNYCRRERLAPIKILAHRGGMARKWTPAEDTVLAVGPEGGFSEEEIALAQAAGWFLLDLGPRILRIETAALMLTSLAVGSGPG